TDLSFQAEDGIRVFHVTGVQTCASDLRYPDVSATHIAFVYGGDIWVVPKEGGVANRLTTPPGEESFPRFSPDGSEIAFTGNYDRSEERRVGIEFRAGLTLYRLTTDGQE